MACQAIRFVPSSVKNKPSRLLLLCHAKPNASTRREGITAITQDRIDICGAAPGKDGEANMAVRKLIAAVEYPSVTSLKID